MRRVVRYVLAAAALIASFALLVVAALGILAMVYVLA